MTQISISPLCGRNSQNNESEFKSYPSSFIKDLPKPFNDTILNFKLRGAEENVAFNQRFLNRRENDNDPSTFSFPADIPSKRDFRNDFPKDEFSMKDPLNQMKNEEYSHHESHLEVPSTLKNEIFSPASQNYPDFNTDIMVPVLKKFLLKLRNASSYRSIAPLKEEHFSLMDDNVYFIEKKEKESNFKRFFKQTLKNSYLLKKCMKFKTFDPYDIFRTLWDIIHFIIIILMFFFIPLQIAFLNRQFQGIRDIIHGLTIGLFLLDILFNLNTGYFSDGVLVLIRKKIFRHYVYKGLFLSDISPIIALFFWNFFLPQENHLVNIVAFLIFGKMSRLKWLYSKLTSQFKFQTNFKGYLDLLHLLMTSVLVLHLLSCFWLMVSLLNMEIFQSEAQTWLKSENLIDKEWYIQYVYSFYWAVVTMMTVGYGDIVPHNCLEIVYATLTIICGCGVYGYYLNTVGILLQDIHKEENKYNSNLRIINKFMDRKLIDNELQMRVREYLRFIWNEEKTQNDEEEAKIIDSLNTHLKEELLLKAYGNILKQFPMFYANFSEKSLRKMVIFMKEIRFIPGDLIYFEEELEDSAIYFINKGCVEIFLARYDKNAPHSLRNLNPGECFGELGFFTGQSREASARSLEFISVFMIKRADFIEIIKENDDDYQKFCMIRDQIMLYGNCQSLRLRCTACGSLEHLVKHCSLLHFVPDIEKIVKKYEFYNDQQRVAGKRLMRKKPNGLKFYKKMQRTALKIQKEIKKEKENEKNEFLRKKFLQGDYDTQYFNSEVSLSSEDADSLDDDADSSGESQQGESNTFHTDTNRNQSKPGTSFENIMKQSLERNTNQLYRITTKEHTQAKVFIEKPLHDQSEESLQNDKKDQIRETHYVSPILQTKSEDNLLENNLEVVIPKITKRHSAKEEMPFKDKNFSGFKSHIESQASLVVNNLIQRASMQEVPGITTKLPETTKKNVMNNKKYSNQFIDKRFETSSLLMVRDLIPKEKDKSLGSHTSVVQESKILSRTKTNHKSRKIINSMVNEPQHHSNIAHSKTSVGDRPLVTETTIQDHLFFFDQVASFKNYFPESNVVPVLDIYDKKRRKIMFLNEMKKLNPENPNIILRKGTKIGTPGINNEKIKEHEDDLKKWSKYTFYPYKMHEMSFLRRVKNNSIRKRRKEPEKLKLERKKSIFALGNIRSKKSNFFGEVIVENGAKKGFTDFVFEIMKDPMFAKWKKQKKSGKRMLSFFKEK